MVYQVGDGLFIAGDETGRKNHRVSPFQFDLLVIVHGDAGEGAHRLPLGTGGDHADLFLGESGELFQVDQDIIVYGEITEFPGNSHIGEHGAPVQEDLAAAAGSRLHHLLYPVDVA